jgi:hypothetical protein
LESFYLADLAAVGMALGAPSLAGYQNKARFRAPDRLPSPSKVLTQLTEGRYQKVGGSRAIGRHLDADNTRSPSFRALVAAIRRFASATIA